MYLVMTFPEMILLYKIHVHGGRGTWVTIIVRGRHPQYMYSFIIPWVQVIINVLISGTGGTWSTSSHGGSAGNLKSHESHDSFGEINKELSMVEDDRESGSEETIIGQTSSQVTVETIKSNSTNSESFKSTETETQKSLHPSPSHVGKRTVSPTMNTRSQSASSIPTSSPLKQNLSPSSPILEESPCLDPRSVNTTFRRGSGSLHMDSDPLQLMRLRNIGSNKTGSQEEVMATEPSQSQPSSRRNSQFKMPQITGVNPGSLNRRMSKGGSSVQPSRVTAVPGLQKSHQRQASMGVYHYSPTTLTVATHHKRHNSFRLVESLYYVNVFLLLKM